MCVPRKNKYYILIIRKLLSFRKRPIRDFKKNSRKKYLWLRTYDYVGIYEVMVDRLDDQLDDRLDRLEGICLTSLVSKLPNSQLLSLLDICKAEKETRFSQYHNHIRTVFKQLASELLSSENKALSESTDIYDVVATTWRGDGGYLVCKLVFSVPIDYMISVYIHLTNHPWFSLDFSTDMHQKNTIGSLSEIMSVAKESTPMSKNDCDNLEKLIQSILQISKKYVSLNFR